MTSRQIHIISGVLLFTICVMVFWAIEFVKEDFALHRGQIQLESFRASIQQSPKTNK